MNKNEIVSKIREIAERFVECCRDGTTLCEFCDVGCPEEPPEDCEWSDNYHDLLKIADEIEKEVNDNE